MSEFYADDWLTIHGGDARDVLPTLPAESVHCVVTSPPYWGLRDYGTATWIGGDEYCSHIPDSQPRTERPANGLTGGKAHVDAGTVKRGDCGRCGASRVDSQLGLEATPEEYVANLVAVFREVRRVLRDDGTVWLNLGDSYANDTKWGGSTGGKHVSDLHGATGIGRQKVSTGLKGKDLVGIPWRVAFALQADGWWLRSDIIWSKPNPMPESVTDRPTKAHEYLFLLSKSARYYYDQEAVREESSPASRPQGPSNGTRQKIVERHEGIPRERRGGKGLDAVPYMAGRNLRSVWTIATRPYPGAHFAVFPPELPERCIKAGTSEGGVCPSCGAPWWRQVERDRIGVRNTSAGDGGQQIHRDGVSHDLYAIPTTTTGWKPSCSCEQMPRHAHVWGSASVGFHPCPTCGITYADYEAGSVPATVLDPFAGSGTVGMMANRLSRRAILIDLNPEYLRQQMKRNAQVPLGV
jgi:DNA modification methylase